MYCSYADNLRKTVSRLLGKEVNFFTGSSADTLAPAAVAGIK